MMSELTDRFGRADRWLRAAAFSTVATAALAAVWAVQAACGDAPAGPDTGTTDVAHDAAEADDVVDDSGAGDETGDGTGDETPDPIVSVPLPLDAEGRTTTDVTLASSAQVRLRLLAGTEVRLADGRRPTGTLDLVLESPYAAYADLPADAEGLVQLRVGLRHDGADVAGMFRGPEGTDARGPVLDVPTTELGAGELLLLYARVQVDDGAGDWVPFDGITAWRPVAWAPTVGEPTTSLEPLTRTGVLLAARGRPAGAVPVAADGFELDFDATGQVAIVRLYEPETAQLLASANFGCETPEERGAIRTFRNADGDVYWIWLEPGVGDADKVRVVSPFANRPLARIRTCDGGSASGLEPAGPFVRTGATRGDPVAAPYDDCTLRYDGHVRVATRTAEGGYPRYRRDVSLPLSEGVTFPDGAYSLLYCDCTLEPDGCDCEATVTTDRCSADVAAAVPVGPAAALGRRQVELAFDVGVWTDATTGLEWEAPAPFPGLPLLTWQASLDRCASLVLAGHDDWRLPTIDELRTLVTRCPEVATGGACPVVDGCGGDCWTYDCQGCVGTTCNLPLELDPSFELCDTHWSSSELADWTASAWRIDFTYAFVADSDKGSGWLARCVR